MGAKITDYTSALLERRKISESDCWEWTRSLGSHGYAEVQWGGSKAKQLVHRLSYSIFIGPVPLDKCVLHKCDNRKCFNPEHLFIGTKSDNYRDMLNKGRSSHQGLKHCKRGHLYTDNLLIVNKGNSVGRQCGACRKLSSKNYYENKIKSVLEGDEE